MQKPHIVDVRRNAYKMILLSKKDKTRNFYGKFLKNSYHWYLLKDTQRRIYDAFFCKNTYRLLVIDCFRKEAPL